jgi:hypothetical protein
MITHIVFFKFSNPSPETVLTARGKLLSMNGIIPLIRHLEVGADIIRSERSYDLALLARFDSLEDLQAYQTHPYHAGEIVPYVREISASILAVDYETEQHNRNS